jgi:hypothetical protein
MDSWVKISFLFPTFPDDESIEDWIVALAIKRDKELGDPPGFAIFDRMDSKGEEQTLVYYFSPVAASACAGMLEPFLPVPCDKPVRTSELAIVYGDLVGTASWDLLK